MMRVLILFAVLVLSGCAGVDFNTNDEYQDAQAVVGTTEANAWRDVMLAREQRLLEEMLAPDFEMVGPWSCVADNPAACRVSVRVRRMDDVRLYAKPDKQISEGYTPAMMLKDVTLGVSPWAAGGYVLGKAFEGAGDRISSVEGDGNTLDMSESRDYRYASGDNSRIDSGDDRRTNYDNDSRSAYGNDSRRNYANDHSATATPTVVERDRAIVVRPEIVPTATAPPFVYNVIPVDP